MKDMELKWCDPDCPHSSFPEKEHLDGACHTFIALFCNKYERFVHKSALCLDLVEEKGEAGQDSDSEETSP